IPPLSDEFPESGNPPATAISTSGRPHAKVRPRSRDHHRWEEAIMRRIGALLGVGGLAVGALALAAPAATAQNSPTFRDCSILVQGVDPDFVQLFGVMLSPHGSLTVPPTERQLQLEASESSDPGDSAGHVTLKATVSAPHVATHTISGAGTGKAVVSVPLTK